MKKLSTKFFIVVLYLFCPLIIFSQSPEKVASKQNNQNFNSTESVLNTNSEPLYFLVSETAVLNKPKFLTGRTILSYETGNIPTWALKFGLKYLLFNPLELGIDLTGVNIASTTKLSEVDGILKLRLGEIIPGLENYLYGKFRYSIGEPYIINYTGDLENVLKEVSIHLDKGKDFKFGLLGKSSIFGLGYTLGGEYTYATGRDYEDYKNPSHIITGIFNIETNITDNLKFGIENRYSHWMDRGPWYEVIPQINYDFSDNLSLLAGVSIPAIGNSYHIMGGLKFNIFTPTEEPVYVEPPPPPPPVEEPPAPKEEPKPVKEEPVIKKTIEFPRYEVPFFVTGYYRPNTTNNLEELISLQKNKLKNVRYIERIKLNSKNYTLQKSFAEKVDAIFQDIYQKTINELFPLFAEISDRDESILITIVGSADPRSIRGKYVEDDEVEFFDNEGKSYLVKKGTKMDNVVLSGLRSYYTGKELDRILSERSKEYLDLKNAGRIHYKYVSLGVLKAPLEYELLRKIEINFEKVKK